MVDPEASDLELLRCLYKGGLSAGELEEMADRFADRYRVQVALIQNPRFPVRRSLNFISSLFPADLVRLIRNKMTNPQVRRRAELEFFNKFQRFPLGEKLTHVRTAPVELLGRLVESADTRILKVIFLNPNCTEEVVLKGLLRERDREPLYQALDNTPWIRRPVIASMLSRHPETPIKMLISIIPWLNESDLKRLETREGTHESVLEGIRRRRGRKERSR